VVQSDTKKGYKMAHNPVLADVQGVSEFNREVIDKLHILRDLLEERSINLKEQNFTTLEAEYQKHLYKEWFENEKLLQKLWNFPQDDNYIKFWNFPACTCPKMDNDDNYPYGRYVQVQDCPIHGWEEK
jgi:hypothetical protein